MSVFPAKIALPATLFRENASTRVVKDLLKLVAAGLLTQAAISVPIRAQSVTPKLEVLPSTAKVYPNRKTPVTVVIRNPTWIRLVGLELSWYTDAVVNVEGDTLKLGALGRNSEHAWLIQLSAKANEEFVPGTVHFRLDYAARGRRGSTVASGVALCSLEVQSGALEDADQVADARIETTLESLTEQTPGKVYVVVTNKTGKSITATVVPTWPYGIKPEDAQKQSYAITLAPHQSNSVEIGVMAKERVRPGKHLLVFDVTLTWNESGQLETRHKIVTQPVDVGVLGESQILTLIGVPSFLLLPGFLVLLTIKIVWSLGWFKGKGQPAEFPLKVKSAEFALVATTVSLFVTGGYSLLLHNLLDGYGLRDIINVWLLSVFFIGFLGYVAVASVYRWHWRRVTPSSEDEPIPFLGKLGRRGLSINLERAEFSRTINNQNAIQTAFLLESRDDAGETIWVAPAIDIRWTDATDDAFKTLVRDQLQAGGSGDPTALATLLRLGTETNGGQQAARVIVNWRPLGGLNRPAEYKMSDLIQAAGRARIAIETEDI
jgi:hypothetical protein